MTKLTPGATIGIVGGGQLGRMSAIAAARLGFRAHILAPEPDGPAIQVAAAHTTGAYDNPAALRQFAAAVDVITFEFENVSADGLDLLASLRPVRPSPAVLRISQDRVHEKSFLDAAGATTAPWRAVADRAALDAAVAGLGLPAVLKTTRLGYDGRGQAILRSPDDLAPAWERLEPRPLVLEAFVDFACEVSVIVARGEDGRAVTFDVTENQHEGGILARSIAPAQIAPALADRARALALQIAEALKVIGVLAVEMFVTPAGGLLVNEIAPRPHNSGHWTIDACAHDQFAMHIRAVAGLPLPAPRRHSNATMRNLIGPGVFDAFRVAMEEPDTIPHWYGKDEARPGRKMGHVTQLRPRSPHPP